MFQYCSCFLFWFFSNEACGMLALWAGIKPIPPALEGEILATGPSGKSLLASFKCTLCLFTLPSWFLFKHLGNRIHFATFLGDRLSTEVGIGERGVFQARGAFRHLFQLVLTLVCHTQSYVRVVICVYRNKTPLLPPPNSVSSCLFQAIVALHWRLPMNRELFQGRSTWYLCTWTWVGHDWCPSWLDRLFWSLLWLVGSGIRALLKQFEYYLALPEYSNDMYHFCLMRADEVEVGVIIPIL